MLIYYHEFGSLFQKGDRITMSEKRRDKRNRILRGGETKRPDGRYRFKYIDSDGKEKSVYSWRLDHNDPYPKDKRKDLSLREKEKQIEQDMFNQIVSNGGNYTVLSLVEKYVSLQIGEKHNTKAGYKTVINILKKEPFGNKRIDKVKLSDAKAWLIKLQQVDGRGYSSIHTIRGVLRPEFQMAEKEIRYVPMTEEVAECFRRIIKNRTAPKAEPIIGSCTSFLFLDKNDMRRPALGKIHATQP